MPILGILPSVAAGAPGFDSDEARRRYELPVHFAPLSPAAAACREVAWSLRETWSGSASSVLAITGLRPRSPSAAVAANAAIALAQAGQQTLLVDADTRRPSVHRLFGLQPGAGFAGIAVGVTPWPEGVRTVVDLALGRFGLDAVLVSPGLDRLHIIDAGSVPAGPPSLAPATLEAFLGATRAAYDVVLIVAPAPGSAPEAAILEKGADGVILVGEAADVAPARRSLEAVGGRLTGLVIAEPGGEARGLPASTSRTHALGAALAAGVLGITALLLGPVLWERRPDSRVQLGPETPVGPAPSMMESAAAGKKTVALPVGLAATPPGPAPAGPGAGRPAGAAPRVAAPSAPPAPRYTVMVERMATARDAEALIAFFRRQGLGAASRPTAGDPFRVAVEEPLGIRVAVDLAERLRAAGYRARLVGRARPGTP